MTVDELNEDFVARDDNWLSGVWATLRERKWLVLGTMLIALVAAIVYLCGAAYLYSAELRVYAAPSTTRQTSLRAGLGGLASLAGISTSGSDTTSPSGSILMVSVREKCRADGLRPQPDAPSFRD